MPLGSVSCPGCEQTILPLDGDVVTASSFEDCLRRCDRCGIGWSNSSSAPVRIWRTATNNVPAEVRAGLLDAIGRALNERNRPMKLAKLASESSEDAVTWTLFSYLAARLQKGDAWEPLGAGRASAAHAPNVLLWGVPIVGATGTDVRERLIEICDRLGEVSTSRTEPDVVVETQGSVEFIEVKYRSNNDSQTNRPWDRYLSSGVFADRELARTSGRYELVRNWRIGCELAEQRAFTLINLLPHGESDAARATTNQFARSLDTRPDRTFRQMTFNDLFGPATRPWPPWLVSYVNSRDLGVVL